jgi:methylenetetrahydrofolate reductase (NADPH)
MALLQFARRPSPAAPCTVDPHASAALLAGVSLEVMPRTVSKIDDLSGLLPAGSRVYVAHIDGTPIADMVATAARLARAGYTVMPHFPARIIDGPDMLADWIARYQGEAGVREALVLAGGVTEPRGAFDSSMQLLETGAFDRAGFTRLHVAGHPEGNRDIDPDGSERAVMDAARWKAAFAERSDAEMAMVTQFVFEAAPVIAWTERLKAEGIGLPVHVGLAGPAKLQTLIRFAIACGVGPSLRVLQRRARDVTKLVQPFTPDAVLGALAAHTAAHPDSLIAGVHLFPLGGITQATDWARTQAGAQA